MPPRPPKETLEAIRERLTREQLQRTTTRIGELAVQTQQNTRRQGLSDLAGETYLTAARNRRQLEQATKEASAKPAAYESTFLVLACVLTAVGSCRKRVARPAHIYKQETGKTPMHHIPSLRI
jgi:hypothetical protein